MYVCAYVYGVAWCGVVSTQNTHSLKEQKWAVWLKNLMHACKHLSHTHTHTHLVHINGLDTLHVGKNGGVVLVLRLSLTNQDATRAIPACGCMHTD
jgi:uncharacterized protein YjlB